MTAWTLTQTNRFKAVMVGAGLTNMYSMYSTNDLQRVLEGYFGGEPWNDLEGYWRRSAMAFIKQAKTPTLILHGAEDKRVPVGQAQELYMGLKKNNVAVELVFFPREPHGLGEPRHQLDKMRREYAWFSKYVLGIDEPPPEKEEKKPAEKPVQSGF
jgi:dipeptidyl aminopeptidase/acylaminoacyl peptidase